MDRMQLPPELQNVDPSMLPPELIQALLAGGGNGGAVPMDGGVMPGNPAEGGGMLPPALPGAAVGGGVPGPGSTALPGQAPMMMGSVPQSPLAPGIIGAPPQLPPTGGGMQDPILAEMLSGVMGRGVQVSGLERRARKGKVRKPTQDQIAHVASRDESRYRETMQRMSRDLAIYRQDEVGLPADFLASRDRAAHSAAVSNLVNRIANGFSGGKIYFKAPWDTTQEEKSSQIMEDACYNWYQRWSRAYAVGGGELIRDIFWYMLVYGRVVIRTLPDPDDDKFPFNIDLIDPATCYPTFGSGKKGLVRMIRKLQVTVGEVITGYGLSDREQRKLLQDLGYSATTSAEDYWDVEGELIEYYDSWWRSVTFMGQTVMPVTAHTYGKVPFHYVMPVGEAKDVRTPLGRYWVDEDQIGWVGSSPISISADQAQKGVSVFHYLIHNHKITEAILTILYNEVERAQNPATITYVAPHMVGKELPPLDVKRGGNNTRTLNLQRVEGLPTSPRPADLAPLMNHATQEWSDGSIPPQMGLTPMGDSGSGVGPEAMFSMLRELTIPYVRAFEHLMSLVFECCMEMYVDFIGNIQPIRVPEYTDAGRFTGAMNDLRVDDIELVGTTMEVRLTGNSLQNLAQKVAMANQGIQGGVFSQRYAMEEILELPNPDKMFGDIIAEKAMQHPAMMDNIIIPTGFIARGDNDLAQAWIQMVSAPQMMQMQAQMQQSAMMQSPPGGVPGGVAGPTGASAPSPTGEPMQPPMQ